MGRRTRTLLVGIIGVGSALLLFGFTVYPLQYGFVESLVLVGILVGVAVFETVLDDTSF